MQARSNYLGTLLGGQNKVLKSPQFIFVGGKGGVGKTTSSSAIGITLGNSGQRTLIVSTDPAHSLGDALDIKYKAGNIFPVMTEANVWALEIDIEQELSQLRKQLDGIDEESIAKKFGLPTDLIKSFGFSDIASILSNPPPGIDEIIALSKIFEYANIDDNNIGYGTGKFDRIVIDTAPTGHTLRLLQLPEFLNTLTSKLLKLKTKVSSMMSLFGSFLGGGNGGPSAVDELFSLLDKLGSLQENMLRLTNILRDETQTQFVVVTIPTQLAFEESRRLVRSLKQEKIRVSAVLCNQVLEEKADLKYLGTKLRAQQKSLGDLQQFLAERRYPVQVTEVPLSSAEVTGVYGLKYFHSIAHKPVINTATNPIDSRRLTIFGGKGGVGKTTSAASWAMRLCDSGLRTLVVSSDPAHSLGDALQFSLSGEPKEVYTDWGASGGELWAMEIDPAKAMLEFRAMVLGEEGQQGQLTSSSTDDLYSSLMGQDKDVGGGSGGSMAGLTDDIADLLLNVNDPPPGTDEVVAMSKIMTFLDQGYTLPNGRVLKFDRIVLDTAPTGHTLRMLQLPLFLQGTMQKMRGVRDKLQGLTAMFNFGGGTGDSRNNLNEQQLKQDRLQAFQEKMQRLEIILHDAKQTEFAVVTIPTEVAVAETKRLLDSLFEDKILVRRLIVNQLLPAAQLNLEDSDAEKVQAFAAKYLQDIRKSQGRVLQELAALAEEEDIPLVTVPFCEYEARTVYVLRYIASFIFPRTPGVAK